MIEYAVLTTTVFLQDINNIHTLHVDQHSHKFLHRKFWISLNDQIQHNYGWAWIFFRQNHFYGFAFTLREVKIPSKMAPVLHASCFMVQQKCYSLQNLRVVKKSLNGTISFS